MYTETEVKFHIANLDKLAERLKALGATLASPRTREMNLRFDTPAGTLAAQSCVLRLRQDAQSRLTYKGPAFVKDGVVHRDEIEFTVSDFDAAKRFIEALGYQVYSIYEKYRTTYELNGLHIMLDEMPYGNFIEIEGESSAEIHQLVEKLGLDAGKAAQMSYLQIFDLLRNAHKLDGVNLTFDDLSGQQFDLSQISLFPADN